VKAYRKDRSSLHQLVCSHTASLIQNLRGRSGGLVLFGRQPISHQASSSHVRTISVATPPHIAIFLSLPTLNSDIRSTPFVSERTSSDQTEKPQWYESDFVLLELIHYGEFLHDFLWWNFISLGLKLLSLIRSFKVKVSPRTDTGSAVLSLNHLAVRPDVLQRL